MCSNKASYSAERMVQFLAWQIALVFFLVLPGSAAAQTVPPNIIVINTDDMNAVETPFMPNLQEHIADRGVTFSNAFVTTAICCPSRASLLTGLYAHNHGVLSNKSGPKGGWAAFRDLGNESATVATALQSAGYRTGLVGKYLNGYGDDSSWEIIPPGWEAWYALVSGQSYYNFALSEMGQFVQYGATEEDYQTDVLNGHAVGFVGAAEYDPRPFFLYIAPAAPHSPWAPAPRHQNEFPGALVPRVPSFNESDVDDKPLWIRDKLPLSDAQVSRLDDDYRARLQTLLAVDDMIGSLIDKLTQVGILDNTVIIFTSDNGWHQGEHRLTVSKGTAFEESIRVPLLIRGPRLPSGVVREQFALNIDIAPTLTNFASTDMAREVDGRSLIPLLRVNPVSSWRTRFLVDLQALNGRIPIFHALRTDTHLFVQYSETSDNELYDMTADPYQLDNFFSTADIGLVDDLSSQLNSLIGCAGLSCRQADH